MNATTGLNSKLALFGGEPVAARVVSPEWPPRSRETAQRLADLYMSGNWSFNLGEHESALCSEFAAFQGAKHAVFMANGTVTLLCALAAHGIGPGDEVIVPAFTWLASAMPVKYLGAKIVFADVEPTTLCLDPERVTAAITKRTKAIMPVHLYGSMVDMDAILAIAKRHNLIVIEDCAQAHGGRWNGRGLGSLGHVGSFSFQHNKNLTSGEGGICITNDAELAARMYRLSHIGYAPGEKMGQFKSTPAADLVCHNFRCTEFQALILRDQLSQFGERIREYADNVKRLEVRLADIPGVRVQSPGRRADRQSYYKLVLIFDTMPLADIPLSTLLKAINAEGIPMEGTYGSVYSHTLFNLPSSDFVLPKGGCPIAEGIASNRAAVLAHQWLSADPDVIDVVANAIAKVSANADALQRMELATISD